MGTRRHHGPVRIGPSWTERGRARPAIGSNQPEPGQPEPDRLARFRSVPVRSNRKAGPIMKICLNNFVLKICVFMMIFFVEDLF